MGERFNWDDLRYFLAVARSGSVSQAARSLSVDHATVIRRMEGLERTLDAKLFQRNTRGYALTHTGEQLLVSARAIEAEAIKATVELRGAHHPVSGTLRISSLEGIGNFFLAGELAAFAAANPSISIELMTIQQLVALSRRDADIAITLQPPSQGRFRTTRLTDYMLYVYGTQSYLEGAAPIRNATDLPHHRFTGYIDDLVFVRELDYLDEIGQVSRPHLQSSSIHAQMEIVRSGYGLCVLPRFIAMRYPDLIAVSPGEINLRRSYWMVTHSDVADSARGRAMIGFLQGRIDAARDLFLGPDRAGSVREALP